MHIVYLVQHCHKHVLRIEICTKEINYWLSFSSSLKKKELLWSWGLFTAEAEQQRQYTRMAEQKSNIFT